jgi:hypothetical protein
MVAMTSLPILILFGPLFGSLASDLGISSIIPCHHVLSNRPLAMLPKLIILQLSCINYFDDPLVMVF